MGLVPDPIDRWTAHPLLDRGHAAGHDRARFACESSVLTHCWTAIRPTCAGAVVARFRASARTSASAEAAARLRALISHYWEAIRHEEGHRSDDRVVFDRVARGSGRGAADDRRHHRTDRRRSRRGGAGRDGQRQERRNRISADGGVRCGRDLPPGGAAGRQLRSPGRAPGLHQGREQGHRRQRRPDARSELHAQAGDGAGDDHRLGRDAADSDLVLVGRRRRRHGADREPAAQRPAVRQRGDHDPGRGARLPLGSDQEHAGTRRRSPAATAATSTTRSTAATTTTTPSAACCSSSRSKRSRNSTS